MGRMKDIAIAIDEARGQSAVDQHTRYVFAVTHPNGRLETRVHFDGRQDAPWILEARAAGSTVTYFGTTD